MQRIIKLICLLLVLILTLCGCPNPILEERRPDKQLMTKWESEDGTIRFEVLDTWSRVEEETIDDRTVKVLYGGTRILGTIAINGENVAFYAIFGVDSMSIFPPEYVDVTRPDYDKRYEVLQCRYKSKSHFVATVTESTYLEEGQKIHFYRTNPE